MGIDIYARWKGMTKKEEEKQATGFSIHHGHVGYLREAYHGEPYATQYFVKEAFEGETAIPAETLLERLPETLRLAGEREAKLYNGDAYAIWQAQEAYVAFYELCKRKEEATGKPCLISASY